MFSSLWGSSHTQLNISNPEILKLGNMLHFASKHIKTGLKIPTLVSIGSQSSGKSSVINGILSMDILPTGKNMVTRTPLRLELIRRDGPALIQFGNYLNRTGMPWKCNVEISLSSPIPTYEEINKVEQTIKNETVKLAGSYQNISMEEINIKLYSPNVPDLTLIDLPGLVQVACTDRGQPKDIKQQIINIISKYGKDPNTIIMAIMASRSDLEADLSLELIKQFDPKGERTIGILTKPDLLEKGSHVAKYINNECSVDLQLCHGYWVVKNRDSVQMETKSLIEGFQEEEKYFQNHPVYSKMKNFQSHFGIKNLSKALTDILVNKLKEIIPSVVTQLKELQEKTRLELDSLGTPLPKDTKAKLPIIHNYLMNFSKNFTNALDSCGTPVTSINTGRQIKEIFINYRKILSELQPFNKKDYPDQFIQNVLENCEGNHMSYPIPPIEVLEYCLTDKNKNPYKVIISPTYICITKIIKSIHSLVDQLLSTPDFQRFPDLVLFVKNATQELILKQETIVRKNILNIIKIEESYIWTDDKDFRILLQHASLVKEKSQVEVIRELLQNYFTCTIKSIQHFVPKSIMFDFVRSIQGILSRVLFDKLRELSEEQEEKLLQERSDQFTKRKDCEARLLALNNTLNIL
jgi:dynamin 1-like protein